MRELGLALTPYSIAYHYDGLLDGLIIDIADAAAQSDVGLPVRTTRTLMANNSACYGLARDVLAFADHLAESRMSSRQELP